jgi:predicted GIY-YIG superfamily endonuclease
MNYIIHFNEKLHHAGHYHGCTDNLAARLAQHARGEGAKLMIAVYKANIGWQVAATWEGGYDVEKAVKLQHNGPRYCPICRQQKVLERMGL